MSITTKWTETLISDNEKIILCYLKSDWQQKDCTIGFGNSTFVFE